MAFTDKASFRNKVIVLDWMSKKSKNNQWKWKIDYFMKQYEVSNVSIKLGAWRHLFWMIPKSNLKFLKSGEQENDWKFCQAFRHQKSFECHVK